MSGKTYILKNEFKDYSKGKKFTRVKKYGEDHKYAVKLEEKDVTFRPRTIEVTDEEIFNNFETICNIIRKN